MSEIRFSGTNLKAARIRAGYASQGSLARALDVSLSSVAGWEVNRMSPSAANVQRLCQLLKVTSDELFEQVA